MKDIVVINIQNFPSGLIQYFQNLKCMKKFANHGSTFNKCYNTNSNASSAFHDVIVDSPFNSLCDHAWHPWCNDVSHTPTLFHYFKDKGYDTYLAGVFGIEKSLDPHETLRKEKSVSKVLQTFGISHFLGDKDDFFACEIDYDFDVKCLDRVLNVLNTNVSAAPKFIWINLLGCHCIPKICMGSVSTPKTRCVSYDNNLSSRVISTAALPRSCDDEPRSNECQSHSIEGCRASIEFEDMLKGQSMLDAETTKIMIAKLYDIANDYFELVSASLEKVIDNETFSKVCVLSTHTIGLREHGSCEMLPWESCSRSFIACFPANKAYNMLHTYNTSLLHKLLDVNMCNRNNDVEDIGMTIQCSPSQLVMHSDKMDSNLFFLRASHIRHSRHYSLHVWFSMRTSDGIFDADKFDAFVDQYDILAYDLTTDSDELKNMNSGDFTSSELGKYLINFLKISLKKLKFRCIPSYDYAKVNLKNTKLVSCHTPFHEEKKLIDASTQTVAQSFYEACRMSLSASLFIALKHHIVNILQTVTVIADTNTNTIFIIPRCYSKIELHIFAKHNHNLIDIEDHTLYFTKNEEEILVNNFLFNIKHETYVTHLEGESVIYEACLRHKSVDKQVLEKAVQKQSVVDISPSYSSPSNILPSSNISLSSIQASLPSPSDTESSSSTVNIKAVSRARLVSARTLKHTTIQRKNSFDNKQSVHKIERLRTIKHN